MRHLLIVHHSRSGHTARIREQLEAGAAEGAGETVEVVTRHAFDAGPDEVMWAQAVILATPANFGYMSGALKDFFERIYHPCLEGTGGLPYALVVKGDTDGSGAVTSVERIVAGLRWRSVAEALVIVGDVEQADLDAAHELGATIAASLDAGIY